MASKKDISAGAAFVELYVKNNRLVKGLGAAGRRLQSWGRSTTQAGAAVAGAGAAMMAPITAAVAAFTREGAALQKIKTQTGATVKELSRLQFAADKLGIDRDDLTGSIEELNIRLGETVRDGVGPAAEALAQLGLDAEALANAPVAERMAQISDALAGIQNETTRGFLADEIFGGDAFKILPLIRQGAAGIRELADEADRLGATKTDEQAAAAAQIAQAWRRLTAAGQGAIFTIGGALADVVVQGLETFTQLVAVVGRFIKENQQLVVIVAAVAAGIIGIGGVITAVGLTVTALGVALSGIAALFTAVGSAVGFLISPLGLVIAAIAAATVAWAKWTESGRQAMRTIRDTFGEILETARETIGGIMDALMVGDLQLAGRIAMQGLRVVVLEGMAGVQELIGGAWGQIAAGIGGRLLEGDVQGAWEAGLQALSAAWAQWTSWIVSTLAAAAKKLLDLWQGTVSSLSNAMLDVAASDTIQGSGMRAILGVDVRAEVERAKRLNEQAQKMGLATNDPMKAAKDSIDATLTEMRSGIDQFLVETSNQYATAAENSAKAAANAAGPGAEELRKMLEAESAKLDKLATEAREKADERRRQFAEDAAAKADASRGVVDTSKLDGSTAGTFSGGALALLGAGSDPVKQIAQDMRKTREIWEQAGPALQRIEREGGAQFA